MANKDRFPFGYSTSFAHNYESQGSGSSGRINTEITVSEVSSGPAATRCVTFNSSMFNDFGACMQVLPLSKMSLQERKDLVLQLRVELEQIRNLQKKIEFQNTNNVAVSSSSDIVSFSKAPRVGNLQKPSALTCGPGKLLNPSSSQKGHGWNQGTSTRFESQAVADAPPSTSSTILLKQCESLLKKLMSHPYGWVFNTPVDVVKLNLPDYFTVIKHPMDLGTIKRKLASFEYSSPMDFHADVKLTFSNAMTYNPPGNDVHIMADTLNKFFEVRWKVIQKKLHANPGEKNMVVKPVPPARKRKISSIEHKVKHEPVKRKMSKEEKQELGRELEASLGDLPDNIVEFLKEQSSHGKDLGEDEDEIEIDIDSLSDDTLLSLRKLLDEHLQQKQNLAKAEPCEIECYSNSVLQLLNESGLSNSSMQLHKGSGHVDEDVDIGRNEPPVSSYPPVGRDKDTDLRNSKYIGSGGSSSSDSGGSDNDLDVAKVSSPVKYSMEHSQPQADVDEKAAAGNLVGGEHPVGRMDQLEQNSQTNPNSVELDCLLDVRGESAPSERQVSPDKLYRAALLKNRFADTILKAREKALNECEKGDPEQQRREREELELQKKKEKARLQAEAKAAEEARRRAEAEAADEVRRRRELEREAARQALLKMEKTVEINENSRFLEDLDMLRSVPSSEQLLHSAIDETSIDNSHDIFGSFKFRGSNPLEQLGLYMKVDEEEEEGEPPSSSSIPKVVNDVEEGEID